MSSDAWLALMLDAPLQSWGFTSRFQRRTTALHPTKSGVIGLISAAMGIPKGSSTEREMLPRLTGLKMTTITLRASNRIRRFEDFHTVGGGYDKEIQAQNIPRNALGKPCDHPTVTRRQYLADAKFGVIVAGDRMLLEKVAAALQNPIWGVWFGRKNCIPADLIHRGLFNTKIEAEVSLMKYEHVEVLERTEEVDEFADGTDSYNDQPVSFGHIESSSEGRVFNTRRIAVHPAAPPLSSKSEI